MEKIKFKDVVELVEKVLGENKFQSVMQNGNPYNMLSYEQKQRFFGSAPPIEWDEIENLNRTFWDCNIKLGMEMTVAAAIAVNLANQCMPEDNRKAMLNQIKQLRDNVSQQWLRRLNKRKKGNGEDDVCGIYNKFELIQKFGYMYDSEDEGNADANDPNAMCPLIMSQLNSGWTNLKAEEKEGKVVVGKRRLGSEQRSFSMLAILEAEFDILSEWMKQKSRLEHIKSSLQFHDFMRPVLDTIPSPWVHIHDRNQFIYMLIDNMLDNTKDYPQDVYDFQSVNKELILFSRKFFDFMDLLDETMTEKVREKVNESMTYMKRLSEMECQIIREQHMKGERTGQFIKPKFNVDFLVFTRILASLLCELSFKYKKVMRLQNYHCFNEKYYYNSYPKYKKALELGCPSTSMSVWNKWCKSEPKLYPYIMNNEEWSEIDKYAALYKEETSNPFYWFENKGTEYFEAQYHLTRSLK